VRVALVGIDGAGKTSIARRLRELAGGPGRVAVLHSLRPHENPDGPLHRLSRQLDALSAVADDVRSPELKLAALYLQLSTYGPIERFYAGTYRPEVTLSDRHPLIDPLVYLPVYGRAAQGRAGRPGPPADLRERLDAIDPAAHASIVAWSDSLARRLGHEADLWGLGEEMLALVSLPPRELLDELGRRFRVRRPDVVILLELEVEEALRRSQTRRPRTEQHENATFLTVVGERYREVLGELEDGGEPAAVERIDTGGHSIDETVEAVARRLPVRLADLREEDAPAPRLARPTGPSDDARPGTRAGLFARPATGPRSRRSRVSRVRRRSWR
jgi:thymidylate kinase